MSNEIQLWAESIQSQLTSIDGSTKRIHHRLDELQKENFTKQDMENFKKETCAPTRVIVQHLNLAKSKFIGIVVGIHAIFGFLLLFKDKIISAILGS